MPIRSGNPFEDIEEFVNRVTQEFEGNQWGFQSSFAIDVVDREEEFVVTADVPGFNRNDIDVVMTDSTLRIEAERENATENTDGRYIRRERDSGTLSRAIRLPSAVDEGGVKAQYSNGVLTVTLPKTVSTGGTQIDIE